MQILPLHPLLAAEIRDFNLDQFEESDWTQIIESLKKYSVLVFRNQEIDNEAQIRFFGEARAAGDHKSRDRRCRDQAGFF